MEPVVPRHVLVIMTPKQGNPLRSHSDTVDASVELCRARMSHLALLPPFVPVKIPSVVLSLSPCHFANVTDALQEQFDDAMFDFSQGRADDAIAKLKNILSANPDFFDAQL